MDQNRQTCRFFVLRYVPDVIKGEFVNIGLVLLPPEAPPQFRFSKNWSRVKNLDPEADIELLEAFRDELSRDADQERMLQTIAGWFSNSIQASEIAACLTGTPQHEADRLAQIYLETPRHRVRPVKGVRHNILLSLQKAFAENGVWQLLQKEIPVSRYSLSGDPLKIDCGYKCDSTIKMFHATPLRTDVTIAKVLAFNYPQLKAGIRRIEHAQAHLTAVVEDGLQSTERIEFALKTLNDAGIQIAPVSNLPDLAALAARDLSSLL